MLVGIEFIHTLVYLYGGSSQAHRLARIEPAGPARDAAAGPPRHRPGAVYGATRHDRSGSEAAERLWRRAGHGDRRTLSHGRLSGRLYRPLRERRVRAPRV